MSAQASCALRAPPPRAAPQPRGRLDRFGPQPTGFAPITQQRTGGHEINPLMMAHHTDIVLSTGETSLTEGPARFDATAGRTYPEWVELRVPDKLELRLDVQRVIHAHDLLDDLPVVRSRLVKPLVQRLVGHPGYFRFESAF